MLEERINKDYVAAMKSRDRARAGALNFLRAQLKNVRIEKKVDQISDAEVLVALKKQVKQRQDSIEQFQQGGRDDLVEKEKVELAILKEYLPEEFSQAQVRQIVQEVIAAQQAVSMKDMGDIMKAVLAQAQGRADNRMVSTLVKEALSTL